MVHLPIYMDNHATTRTDPRVVEAMLPYFTEHYGNAASRSHVFGWQALEAVDQAREQVAALIGAQTKEIIFTSGATESDNLALKGTAPANREARAITSSPPRSNIPPCSTRCKTLQSRKDCTATVLPVDAMGLVAPCSRSRQPSPIRPSSSACRRPTMRSAPCNRSAKSAGSASNIKSCFMPTRPRRPARYLSTVEKLGIDLLTLSAHKMYGPKGVGALYVRRRAPHVRLQPLLEGGGQERGLRSGTLAVPLIVGFGMACELCRENLAAEAAHCLDSARTAANRPDGSHRWHASSTAIRSCGCLAI